METKAEYSTDSPPEHIRYRNPVKSAGYAQVYHMATLDPRITDGAYRLFNLYLMYAQQKDLCWPGRAALSDMLQCSEQTISRRNRDLEEAGYITRQRRMGTSSITWIEDIEDIPFLKDLAQQHLASRNKNGTTHVPKMVRSSDQICIVEQEQDEQEQDEPAAPAADQDYERALSAELVDVDDKEITCPNPHCAESIVLDGLSKSECRCPHCKQPLWIKDTIGVAKWKPPQKFRSTRRKRETVGDIIPDIPRHLAPFQANGNKRKLLELWGKNRDVVTDSLEWARNKVAKNEMQASQAVRNALTAAERKIAVLVEPIAEPINLDSPSGDTEPIYIG